MNTKKRNWFVAGIVVVVVLIGYFSLFWPPAALKKSFGTIGGAQKINKFRGEQFSDKDVILDTTKINRLIQSALTPGIMAAIQTFGDRINVHSLVRAKTKPEAKRVGKYMIRPVLVLERLSFLEPEGKVGYRYGENGAEREVMDYLEFIARVTSHIPDKGQVMVRYYGLYANAHRGKAKKASLVPLVVRLAEDEPKPVPSKGWAEMIRKVYEVDPMACPKCGGTMKIIAFITEYAVMDRIIDHLKLRFVADKPPPSHVFEQVALAAAEESGEYF